MTAAFMSGRPDKLGDLEKNPGPGHYNLKTGTNSKTWQTTIGAFGST